MQHVSLGTKSGAAQYNGTQTNNTTRHRAACTHARTRLLRVDDGVDALALAADGQETRQPPAAAGNRSAAATDPGESQRDGIS